MENKTLEPEASPQQRTGLYKCESHQIHLSWEGMSTDFPYFWWTLHVLVRIALQEKITQNPKLAIWSFPWTQTVKREWLIKMKRIALRLRSMGVFVQNGSIPFIKVHGHFRNVFMKPLAVFVLLTLLLLFTAHKAEISA